MSPKGCRALHPVVAPLWARQGPGVGVGEMSSTKMQIHADKWCRKHVLYDSGNLDISQSQMNMSASTAGQLLGYLKRRFRKQAGVTSQAAGTVYVQLSGQGSPLLWCYPPFPVSLCLWAITDSQKETQWGWADRWDTYQFTLVRHYLTAGF